MEKVASKQSQDWNVIYGEISAEISAAEFVQDMRRNCIAH